MVRTYKRKPGHVNPAKRRARAAELRDEGLSLRQIAERLSCTHTTVRRDLAQWDAANKNVVRLEHSAGTSLPPGGGNVPAECSDADPNVISLSDRRKRA